jgi:alkylhydroperoxidase family enzyme
MMGNFDLPEDKHINDAILKRLKTLPAINIYRLISGLPTIFNPWIDMVQGLYKLDFDMRLREIAILRQAHQAKSNYELHQHRFIALANGVSAKEIDIIIQENPVSSLDAKGNLICKVADEIETEAMLTPATREQLISHFGKDQALQLITILSFYCCVARFLNATEVPIENDTPLSGKAAPTP